VLAKWIVSAIALASSAKSADAQTDGVPLVDLLQRASQVLDAPIFYEPREVADCTVDVGGELDAMAALPRDEFLVLFEKCLQKRQFAHLERTIGTVHSHTVMHLDPDRMKNLALKTVVRRVSWDEIAAMADRQALVITTCYCTTVPAEQVVATIEARFDASKVEDIRHVEGTNAILMTAFAANLAQLLPTLAQLGARPAEHEVAVLPRKPVANSGEPPVVLRCEPKGLRLSHAVDAATQLVGEPFFYEPRARFSRLTASTKSASRSPARSASTAATPSPGSTRSCSRPGSPDRRASSRRCRSRCSGPTATPTVARRRAPSRPTS
jgi:hypothetical protein